MATGAGKIRRSFNLSDEAVDALSAASSVEQRPELDILEAMILHQCPPGQPITDLDRLALGVAELKADVKALAGLIERVMADGGASSKTAEPSPAAIPTPKEALQTFYESNRAFYHPPETPPVREDVRYADTKPPHWFWRGVMAAIYTNKKGF